MAKTDEILKKYSGKIESQLNSYSPSESYSREYQEFKQEMIPELSSYKRWASSLGNLIKIKLSDKETKNIETHLNHAHLDITPSQSASLAITALIVSILLTIGLVAIIGIISGALPIFLLLLGLIASVCAYFYVYSLPKRLASIWRLRASSQMVPAVLYTVIYMKHTSNLERAIQFMSEHIEAPLSYDFKKVIYDVEIGKYQTVKQSLDGYLDTWRDYSPEFIESFHLIESSLFEPSDAQRVNTLERALTVMLDGIYDSMLNYSREIRTPLTNIYMLGIILPTLALALLPLAAVLISQSMKWYHIVVLFNIIVPLLVFFMTSEVLLKRPGGYGESALMERNPLYAQFTSKRPWIIASLIAIPIFILGLMPFIFQASFLTQTIGLKSDYTFGEIGLPFFSEQLLFDFKTVAGKTIGPFGIMGVIMSLLIPLSIALFFSISYKLKTKELIKAREETKDLEKEFTNSIFQLGNRLGDGVPAEIVFSRVAESTQGMKTQSFFALVNQNIQEFGMPVEQAVFDINRGAIRYYPSAMIATSMRILVESVKKGLTIAARSMMAIAEYVKNIRKINDRLKDLLAEVVSDMRSNMTFLAPLLAGVIMGLTTMIAIILNKLKVLSELGGAGTQLAGVGSVGSLLNLFDVTSIIPPYFVQISIGIYLIEIIFILTGTLVTVDAGRDTLKERSEFGSNLKKGMTLYILTSLISILALTGLASVALSGLGG